MRQGTTMLHDFMLDVMAKLCQVREERVLCVRFLTEVVKLPEDQTLLLDHFLRGGMLHREEVTLIRTVGNQKPRTLRTFLLAAEAVADQYQPLDKRGMVIRGVVQDDNYQINSNTRHKRECRGPHYSVKDKSLTIVTRT